MITLSKLAISGFDGIGKTQQISFLSSLGTRKITHRLKRLVEYGDNWPAQSETASHEWWFGRVEFDDLAQIIIQSLNIRNQSCISDKVNIFDRGTLMFKAVLAATYSTKHLGSLDDAYERVDNMFADLLEYTPEEYELLLVPNSVYQQKIKTLLQIIDIRTNQYTPEQAARYASYQGYLGTTIEHYYDNIPQERRVVVNDCILNIQNEIRSRANLDLGISLPLACENFERGIALGGLSESGKSGFGDALSKKYGFYRLKLRYFEDILIRAGQDVHAGSMGFEYLSFLHCHPHVTRASVESIHDPILPAYFKLLLGDRFTIAFLTAPEDLRISRTVAKTGMTIEEATSKVRSKDETKRSRGAHQVEDIADLVFSNESDGIDENTQRFAKKLGL